MSGPFDLPVLAEGSGGPDWLLWVVVPLLVVGFVVSAIRFRQRGPALGFVPRRWRGRVNGWYGRHGWQEPYDADGNKVQRW